MYSFSPPLSFTFTALTQIVTKPLAVCWIPCSLTVAFMSIGMTSVLSKLLLRTQHKVLMNKQWDKTRILSYVFTVLKTFLHMEGQNVSNHANSSSKSKYHSLVDMNLYSSSRVIQGILYKSCLYRFI